MYILSRGSVGGGCYEWMRGLDLGFTNSVRIGGIFYLCLCLGCVGVGGEWVGCFDQGLEVWSGVM